MSFEKKNIESLFGQIKWHRNRIFSIVELSKKSIGNLTYIFRITLIADLSKKKKSRHIKFDVDHLLISIKHLQFSLKPFWIWFIFIWFWLKCTWEYSLYWESRHYSANGQICTDDLDNAASLFIRKIVH